MPDVFLNATAPLMIRIRHSLKEKASNSSGELFLNICYSKRYSILKTWFDNLMKYRIRY